jgi:hypothetical protein
LKKELSEILIFKEHRTQLEAVVNQLRAEVREAKEEFDREQKEKTKYILLWEKRCRDCEDHTAQFRKELNEKNRRIEELNSYRKLTDHSDQLKQVDSLTCINESLLIEEESIYKEKSFTYKSVKPK